MPFFDYRARDRAGNVIAGVLEAEAPGSVAQQLDTLGYFPISIKPKEKKWLEELRLKDRLRAFQKVKQEDFILFNRQLATLVAAGLPFIRSLETVQQQTKSPRLKSVLERIRFDVEGGSSFSDALSLHTDVFSALYINMIRAGEEGGIMDGVLNRLATLAEHEAVLRQRISSAMRYPIIVVIALVAAVVLLMRLVVPQFVKLYDRFDVELPLPTRILIVFNSIFQRYWLVGLVGLVLFVVGLGYYLKTDMGRRQWDRIKIRIPIFGAIFLKSSMSRFARIFSALLGSGVPILRTLEIVSNTVSNVFIEQVILNIRESVREGEPLAAPMGLSRVFPPIVVQMVAVGEETGRLDEMLDKVSDYYDAEVEYTVRNLTTTLEPLLIVLIGGVVLFLALAIFMPWWNVVSIIRR